MEVIEVDSGAESSDDSVVNVVGEEESSGSNSVDVGALQIPTIDLDLYVQASYHADLTDVQEPTFAARSVRRHKLLELQDRLEELDWIEGASQFSVAIKKMTAATGTEQEEKARVVVEGDMLQVELVLVDGRHRLRALKFLAEKDDKWMELLRAAPVQLWTRKDEKHLTALEMLQIARHLNEVASNVIVPDFLDHIHGAISTIQILQEEKDIPLHQMKATNLAASFLESNIDDKVWKTASRKKKKSRMRHMMRYAAIALRLARSKTCYKKVEMVYEKLRSDCSEIVAPVGVTHLSSNILNDMDDGAYCFAMDVLQKRLGSRQKKHGNFESFHRDFYKAILDVYTEICRIATFKSMEVGEVLRTRVIFSGSEGRSIHHLAVAMFRDFGTIKSRKPSAHGLRMSSLRKNLKKAFGTIEAPPAPAPAPSPASGPGPGLASASASASGRAADRGQSSAMKVARRGDAAESEEAQEGPASNSEGGGEEVEEERQESVRNADGDEIMGTPELPSTRASKRKRFVYPNESASRKKQKTGKASAGTSSRTRDSGPSTRTRKGRSLNPKQLKLVTNEVENVFAGLAWDVQKMVLQSMGLHVSRQSPSVSPEPRGSFWRKRR